MPDYSIKSRYLTNKKQRIIATIVGMFIVGSVISIALQLLSAANPTLRTAESVRAFDSANTITDPTWFVKAYKEGFRLYVIHSTAWGTCNAWSAAQSQLRMALDAGLKVAAYTRDPRCWKEGVRATGEFSKDLQFFALDIETDPGIPVTRDMVDGMKGLGVRPIIYTGSGMWADVQKHIQDNFSDVALWEVATAEIDYTRWQEDYKQPTPVSFGGWNQANTMRVGAQQRLEYNLNGIMVDLSSFKSSFLR